MEFHQQIYKLEKKESVLLFNTLPLKVTINDIEIINTELILADIKTIERMGISALIVEDKKGLKKNSLFGTKVKQEQENIKDFCKKISVKKHHRRTRWSV